MTKYMVHFFFGICFTLFIAGCSSNDSDPQPTTPEVQIFEPVAINKTNSTKLYIHYMAWFETNESSGNNQWGYHWTMNNQNPNNIDANGKRAIAAHYYPLIGPYHSGDKKVIENHLLLMKYSGIDGVLIDWYGKYDVYDYQMIRENSEQIIAMLDKVGLEYAIVYEDRFLQNIVDAGLAPSMESAAKGDMTYMKNTYFNDANYIKINNKPLLLNFGPITLTSPSQWTDVLGNLNPKPTFLTLWNQSYQAGSNAQGEYTWVYQNNTNLSNFYTNNLPNLEIGMGSAYPGFNDFYEEGGTNTVIGWTIPHNNGATLDDTLTMSGNANLDYLQLITWNDFGEGTMFEPTQEFGYNYINKLKTFAGVQQIPSSVFNSISQLYDLRKANANNSGIQKKLDQAFYYFVSLQVDEANAIIDAIQ